MLTNPVWRALLGGVVVLAVGLSAMACGSSPTSKAAATELVLHAFVGGFTGQPALKVALLVGHDSAVAYLCDNHSEAVLLSGSVRQHGGGGTADLKADDGTTLSAPFGARDAAGTVTVAGRAAAAFTAALATGSAGLYEASAAVAAGRLRGGWVVGNDGAIAGALRLNSQLVGNPALQSTVTFGGATLVPLPVRTLPVQLPLPPQPATRPIAIAIPVVHPIPVLGSGFDAGAPVQVSVLEVYPVNPRRNPPPAEQNITVQSDGSITTDLKFFVTDQQGVVGHGSDVDARAIEYPGDPSLERVADLGAEAC